ncbi:hypothetical protein, partial [Methylobacterium ajmalii]
MSEFIEEATELVALAAAAAVEVTPPVALVVLATVMSGFRIEGGQGRGRCEAAGDRRAAQRPLAR